MKRISICKHKLLELLILSMPIWSGFVLLNNYGSGVLRNYGLNIELLSYIWIISPLTGLILNPIIGYIGDKNHFSIFGKRRLYILIGLALGSIALLLIPNAHYFNITGAIIFYAIISIFLLDIGLQISLEPYKSLIIDYTENDKIKNRKVFAYSNISGSLSMVLMSILPFLLNKLLNNHSSKVSVGQIDPNIKYTFYMGSILFFSSFVYLFINSIKNPITKNVNDVVYVERRNGEVIREFTSKYWLILKTLRVVGSIQFFSWFALFMLYIFTTDMVASHIFHLNHKDTANTVYYEAQEWTGVLFAFTTAFSIITSIILMYLPKNIKNNVVHSVLLLIGFVGLISCFFISTKELLILSFCCIGCAQSSIYILPYALLSEELHSKNTGLYVSVLNFFIIFPQIISGLTSGIALKYLFNNNPIYITILSGLCLFTASIISFFMIKE